MRKLWFRSSGGVVRVCCHQKMYWWLRGLMHELFQNSCRQIAQITAVWISRKRFRFQFGTEVISLFTGRQPRTLNQCHFA
ncbi:hypothetical protein HNY73_014456 [Argiope bruennichi]|uniref:Uncharacterized protein n=1 Tax=Argiope bruennichi TaxID=94029 RepID=A0A8T0EQR4_ARGBR|nr:hypothetical protein HNY73_014456 [Argiope bruennichi]